MEAAIGKSGKYLSVKIRENHQASLWKEDFVCHTPRLDSFRTLPAIWEHNVTWSVEVKAIWI